MAGEIIVPTVGESISEVIIAEWLKPIGSWVEQDEPIVSLDTDKVSVEVLSPVAGFSREALKEPDDTANVGEVIGRVEAAERPAEEASAAPAETPAGARGTCDTGGASHASGGSRGGD